MKMWFAVPLALAILQVPSLADDFDRARGIIGILPLPELFGSEPCVPYKARDIELFRSPGSVSHMGKVFVSRPQAIAPSGGCTMPEVSVTISGVARGRERLPTLEFSYENPGAIVLQRKGPWFEIALGERNAWVQVQDDARYLPVETLLADALAYLRLQGRPVLLKSPGQGEAIWQAGRNSGDSLPVEILGFRELSGRLWVQVRLLEKEPCSDESTHVPALAGWLPFHDASGMPAVWFYSRGC